MYATPVLLVNKSPSLGLFGKLIAIYYFSFFTIILYL